MYQIDLIIFGFSTQMVLSADVGPKSFKKLSDICQKSVKKLSVAKISQNSVRNVSEFCQKTVRCKIVSEVG